MHLRAVAVCNYLLDPGDRFTPLCSGFSHSCLELFKVHLLGFAAYFSEDDIDILLGELFTDKVAITAQLQPGSAIQAVASRLLNEFVEALPYRSPKCWILGLSFTQSCGRLFLLP